MDHPRPRCLDLLPHAVPRSPLTWRARARRLAAGLGGLAAVAGCSPTATAPSTASTRERTTADEPGGGAPSAEAVQTQTAKDPAGAPIAPAAWEVHEWGVITVDGARLTRGKFVAGPAASDPDVFAPKLRPERPPHGQKRKPVIYVHLGKGVDAIEFDVSVTPKQGRVVEHWPDTTPDSGVAAAITWQDVRAATTSCDGASFTYPSAGDPACVTADGLCEVAELASVETSDGACLEVAGKTYEHLFYRGELDALPLGVTLAEQPGGALRLTNVSGAALTGAMRVTTDGSRPSTKVDAIAELAPGAHVDLPAEAGGTEVAASLAAIRVELVQRGLTDPEADAFLRAWSSDLFGIDPNGPDAPKLPAGTATGATPAKHDLLLLWLDREVVDELLPLAFTPAPTRIERAHLIVIER